VPQAASFIVRSGGVLAPASISATNAGAIELRVVSHDSRRRRVLLRTPTPQAITVPGHGHASMLVTGLTPGRYRIDVDGVARGTLLIGG
jgi:hypothetical protein